MEALNLTGKTAVVMGIANRWSIAYAIAEALQAQGARLAITYQNERVKDAVYKLTSDWPGVAHYPCDISEDSDIDTVRDQVQAEFGQVDILVHCIAFAPPEALQDPFRNMPRSGFHTALDVSAYSLIAVAQRFAPLMPEGGSIITLTYMASERVVPNYNAMAIAKAALENSVRYLANDLGQQGIRVNALSAGPVRTASARGVPGFVDMMKEYADKTPLRRNITVGEVGKSALYLCSDLSSGVTGTVHFVDAGYHILGM